MKIELPINKETLESKTFEELLGLLKEVIAQSEEWASGTNDGNFFDRLEQSAAFNGALTDIQDEINRRMTIIKRGHDMSLMQESAKSSQQ